MFVKIVVPLAAVSAAVLLLAFCFGGDEESAPRMTSEPTSSAPTSATVTVKVTEPTTVPKGSEPVTVTWRADVPTTSELPAISSCAATMLFPGWASLDVT
jgi:hypothetical protein